MALATVLNENTDASYYLGVACAMLCYSVMFAPVLTVPVLVPAITYLLVTAFAARKFHYVRKVSLRCAFVCAV